MRLEKRLEILADVYQHQMPFNRYLDITIPKISVDEVCVTIAMRRELVGNFVRGILHGGVISSVLDLTGGLIATVELFKHLDDADEDWIIERLSRVGTIDLRVDYLRAGKGKSFSATGSILRKGNRVAVVRTELNNQDQLLIAAGTGTYLIS